MKFIADLHIHSHYSRATSRDLDPEHLALWAKKKGITVIGTGDFTHPGWVKELREKLVEAEPGLYRLKQDLESEAQKKVPDSCLNHTRFLLSGEISCIYKRGGKTRKIHHLLLFPDFPSVERFNQRLDRIGNIRSDGRPILGLDSRDLLETALEVSEKAFLIPAHVWTPWFSLFGSKSGFDTIEECFGDLTHHIHALETGLSSDPPMNRLLSALDRFLLVSNSDAHSPSKIGREANIFDTDLDYDHILGAMISREGFEGTIEFFPEEGKYHFDGHRKCSVRLHPKETREHEGICPACGKPLTIGVFNRVEELADRDDPSISKAFFSLIPLTEILSEIYDCGPSTKRVTTVYEDLLAGIGPELYILMDAPLGDIESHGGMLLAKAIERMRHSQVIKEEGYDGEYGVIRLFDKHEKAELMGQETLFQGARNETPRRKVREGNRVGAEQRRLSRIRPGGTKSKETLTDLSPLNPILDPLNQAQRDAVLFRGGHLVILAGPGTGKTMTLTHRIAHLIQQGDAVPGQILALTFTNKAAREMRERITDLFRGPALQGTGKDHIPSNILTFHGFCLQVLRRDAGLLGLPQEFSICSEHDIQHVVREALSGSPGGKREVSRLLKAIPRLKRALVQKGEEECGDKDLLAFLERYNRILRANSMLDLDDLEVETLRLLMDHPEISRKYAESFPWVFVDEYQDTNPVQVDILKQLVHSVQSPSTAYICAIGDPDQAIYGFRGADVGNFLRFEADFPGGKKIILGKNYRSTGVILSSSAALMEKGFPLVGTQGPGVPISLAECHTAAEEAEMIVEQIEKLLGGTTYFSIDSGRVASHEDGEDLGFGDIGVLYRLNFQGDELEEAFSRSGIPYSRSGEKPLVLRYPVNVVRRFLQLVGLRHTPHHVKAYLRSLEEYDITSPLAKVLKEGKHPGLAAQEMGPLRKQCDGTAGIPESIKFTLEYHGLDNFSGEDEESLSRLEAIASNFQGDLESFLDALSLERGIDHTALSGDRVALMSLHASKGLEWPVVFITGCESGLIPCTLFGEHDLEEERRLLYVGMTRAKRRLIITRSRTRSINGKIRTMNESPFLRFIPKKLLAPLERAPWNRKKKTHQQLHLFQPGDVHS
ncbi:MAG: UvrD-helicase domain-containing protein [Deltaproteobacteria bacterium]|nr:UvrD-helicase domain-containing protein [Deltaproteobacteria bacterium]